MNLDDVRMLQPGDDLGLGLEEVTVLLAPLAAQYHLQGYQAVQAHLPRPVDDAHAAAAQLAGALVAGHGGDAVVRAGVPLAAAEAGDVVVLEVARRGGLRLGVWLRRHEGRGDGGRAPGLLAGRLLRPRLLRRHERR